VQIAARLARAQSGRFVNDLGERQDLASKNSQPRRAELKSFNAY
jgi:hypothetical protein